ncbi:MAG: xylosidase [Planctomycetes bacterium]|nr:xylosidase [Planctomycetota bacterium]
MLNKIFFLILVLAVSTPVTGQVKHGTGSIYPSYKGLIMAGYQGWFIVENGTIYTDQARARLDIWPDVSEYEKTYPTGFKMSDGSTAKFFNSGDKGTIDLHFKWMKEYGVDGVFMQRFFSRTRNPKLDDVSVQILKHAFEAASKNKRAIALMYDLSGLRRSGEDCSSVIEDWKFLVDSLRITNQEGTNTYLHHNGKPLVAIWGLGFPDRSYNIRKIGVLKLIDFLKNDPEYGGCSIMVGVPTYWRDLKIDCLPDPYLHEIIKKSDVVMPWMVQRFTSVLYYEMDRYRDMIVNDMKWCKEYHIDYAPCVTPGFSWHNLSRNSSRIELKPVGSIPRLGGKFYWQQFYTAIHAGANMIYVAMFDEVNEGTAIFKCTDTPPVSDIAKFITMDGMPSDHYLWLTGKASKMLRNEIPMSREMPKR